MATALSALELAVAEEGRPAGHALEIAAHAVQRVEELGYQRVWFAEHHGSPFAASVVPAVLIAHFAARTSRIRLGSGGVLAPNHAPLALAEQFATLATLHPGRIDMGVGRGPGTFDQTVVRALRRGGEPSTDAEYQEDVTSLLRYLAGEGGVRLIGGWDPERAGVAPFLLSSSAAGAELAARLGVPVAFAHHIRPENTVAAARRYRELFTPSRWSDRPYVMVAVETVVAETAEEAAYLAHPIDLMRARMFQQLGETALLPPEVAATREIPAEVRDAVLASGAAQARGTVETVRDRFAGLVADTGADELMLAVPVYDAEKRARCYELAAKAAR
ncbi:luciferase family oxidoreductase group 1 [Catenuloplanes nepalensis]|uniref:Luciferase family oxidoreductase group 1 n=1 Tax=Catenuloplanes nepalensis TaxID=587533 RepID=A0ABT9MQ93_9ACTN|nr:MsnO8 family LLM class oxidoreductase [Catenuloplanes nepalensis]MDP9793595.1 luciferase family oxidoreductase group 1 [Catenuloplanes nepalensis]